MWAWCHYGLSMQYRLLTMDLSIIWTYADWHQLTNNDLSCHVALYYTVTTDSSGPNSSRWVPSPSRTKHPAIGVAVVAVLLCGGHHGRVSGSDSSRNNSYLELTNFNDQQFLVLHQECFAGGHFRKECSTRPWTCWPDPEHLQGWFELGNCATLFYHYHYGCYGPLTFDHLHYTTNQLSNYQLL